MHGVHVITRCGSVQSCTTGLQQGMTPAATHLAEDLIDWVQDELHETAFSVCKVRRARNLQMSDDGETARDVT